MNENNTSSKVISVSFSNRPETKAEGKKTDEQMGQVLPFSKPVKNKTCPLCEKEGKNREESVPAEHSLNPYIRMLRDKGVISKEEFEKLMLAVSPLMEIIPTVESDIVQAVRAEFAGNDKPVKDEIADMEEKLWRDAAVIGQSLIPGFNLERSRQHFTEPSRRIFFLRPELVRPVKESDVPYDLLQGEMFFFIVLRMFRRQYEKNLKNRKQEAPPVEDKKKNKFGLLGTLFGEDSLFGFPTGDKK